MKRSSLTQELWNDWLTHDVTQALLKQFLPAQIEDLHQKWENGEFLGADAQATMQANATAVGRAGAFRYIMGIEFEELKGALEDGE